MIWRVPSAGDDEMKMWERKRGGCSELWFTYCWLLKAQVSKSLLEKCERNHFCLLQRKNLTLCSSHNRTELDKFNPAIQKHLFGRGMVKAQYTHRGALMYSAWISMLRLKWSFAESYVRSPNSIYIKKKKCKLFIADILYDLAAKAQVYNAYFRNVRLLCKI